MNKSMIINSVKNHYGFKKDSDFANYLGITSQVLTNWKARNTYDAELIYTKCLEISSEWLLTGEGDMLKIEKTQSAKRNLIPLYNDVASIGGTNELNANIDAISSTTEYIDAGDWFPGATAAIRHYGDSMVEYPSGSILALKIVQNEQLIFWGKPYSIETTEGRITKKLNKSKIDTILVAHSSNVETYPNGSLIHEPIEIPKESIVRLYQVLGCVTKEYSSGAVQIINK